jgi:hypothetical protein
MNRSQCHFVHQKVSNSRLRDEVPANYRLESQHDLSQMFSLSVRCQDTCSYTKDFRSFVYWKLPDTVPPFIHLSWLKVRCFPISLNSTTLRTGQSGVLITVGARICLFSKTHKLAPNFTFLSMQWTPQTLSLQQKGRVGSCRVARSTIHLHLLPT